MKPIADILDECLADVREGRKTVDECTALYPEHRDELRRLLGTALAIRPPNVQPDPRRKLLARHAFVEALAGEKRARRRAWWPWSFELPRGAHAVRLAAITLNVLAILILTTSAVATAKEAQPGDLLYGLKTGIEQVQVAVALTPETKAQIRLQIAAERLNEVQKALASDKPTVADSAATAYAATMDQAQRDLATARPSGERLDAIQRSLQDNLSRQQEVLAQASEKGATGTEHAIRQVQERHAAAGATGTAGVSVTGSVQPREPTSQAKPTPEANTDAAGDEPERNVVVIQGAPAVPTESTPATPTVTPTPRVVTGAAGLTPEATSSTQETAVATATQTPSITATEPTRTGTPTPTATRRATVTPSATPTSLPASQTVLPTSTGFPQRRGGIDGGDEEIGRPGAISTVTGGISASGRTPTVLPTTTPTTGLLHRGLPVAASPTTIMRTHGRGLSGVISSPSDTGSVSVK